MNYYPIPRSLLRYSRQFGLSADAIILYARLSSLLRVSARNGWIEGNIPYARYARATAQADFGWSKGKTIAVFRQLVDAGLLSERQPWAGGSKVLYLRRWVEPSAYHTMDELKAGGFAQITTDNVGAIPEDYIELPTDVAAAPDLTATAKLLYAIIRDAVAGAERYGRDFCTLSAGDTMALLGCSENTMYAAYAQLERAELVERGVKGFGAAREVRTTNPANFAPQSRKKCTTIPQILNLQSRKKWTRDNPFEITFGNQLTGSSLSATASADAEAPALQNEENDLDWAVVAADVAQLTGAKDTADEVVAAVAELISDDTTSRSSIFFFGDGITLSKAELLALYARIDRYTMDTLAAKLVGSWGRIQDKPRYICAALINAQKHEGEAHYTRTCLTA